MLRGILTNDRGRSGGACSWAKEAIDSSPAPDLVVKPHRATVHGSLPAQGTAELLPESCRLPTDPVES